MGKYYLVDFENVSNDGLKGLDDLQEQDGLIIFYSDKTSKLTFGMHKKLEKLKARKEYISIDGGSKNSLDFQLSTYLGYLVSADADAEFAIISKDTGYDAVVKFWKKRNVAIVRANDIALSTPNTENTNSPEKQDLKTVIATLGENSGEIKEIIKTNKTKQAINNALVKKYRSEKAGVIYKKIKPYISDKK